jgi:uncharacterized paraquat-inducible protein A
MAESSEILECEECGESFNATETDCEQEYHCPRCAGEGPGCAACAA